MARIQVLDRQTAELIAAGEVIERPSSVVKELIENAIDAGAGSITVELKSGGVRYIRVTDDGGGIQREDVPKAFLRHATSKVRKPEDLYEIGTLGFRGEALASVAAVSRVELLTKTPWDTLGTRYQIAGGVPGVLEDAGCPGGTTIVVEDLFYNVPARMKFLKKDATEGNAISGLMDRLALSHPDISFKLIKDGQRRLHTPGDGKLLSAIYAVYGGDFGGSLAPVSYTLGSLGVEGYLTKPETSRANRAMEHFFINHRYVKCVTMMAALEDAYKNTIMTGKFPGCVLNLTLPHGMVDANVHPAKLEEKLSDERAVYETVLAGCKLALGALDRTAMARDVSTGYQKKLTYFDMTNRPDRGEQQRLTAREYRQLAEEPPEPSGPNRTPAPKAGAVTIRDQGADLAEALYRGDPQVFMPPKPPAAHPDLPPRKLPPEAEAGLPPRPPMELPQREESPAEPPAPAAEEAWETPADMAKPAGEYALIGEAFHTYLLVQGENELLLVDKHAAHERILFNRLMEAHSQGEIPRQLLLAPVRVSLTKERYDALVQNPQETGRAGFAVEDFGEGTVLVREVPAILEPGLIGEVVQEMADMLFAEKGRVRLDLYDELYHSIACKAAIKGNSFTSRQEQEELLRMLREDPAARHCPHGRPIMIAMTRRELETMFGRIQ